MSSRALRRGDAVKFIPVYKKNTVHIVVDYVFSNSDDSLVWVYGVRFRPGHGIDSQARAHSYLVEAPGERAELTIIEDEEE